MASFLQLSDTGSEEATRVVISVVASWPVRVMVASLVTV